MPDQHPHDEFGDKWERACYKAATQGMINVLIAVGVIFAAMFILGWLGIIRPAHGSAVCLTKSEARALWPKRHIYWYSADHCWSNRRGGPPSGVKYDLIKENHAEVIAPTKKRGTPVIKIVKAEDYNELDAQADADLFFNAQPVPFWRFSALDDGFSTWHRRVEDLLK